MSTAYAQHFDAEARQNAVTTAQIVGRVGKLVPDFRRRHAETDLLAKAPADMLDVLEDAGVFSILRPRAYGGLQADISTWRDVVTEIGRGDGGVAWACSLINSCIWLTAAMFPRSVTDEVFADRQVRVAGVFSPRDAKARRVKGGVMIDKSVWYFNSGVQHVQWDLLGMTIYNAAGEPEGPAIGLIPMRDVKILNDWDTIGLRGSGSSNVAVENLFIPNERLISTIACVEGRQPGAFRDEPLYRAPFTPLMNVLLTFPVLGMGEHLLETFIQALPKRDIKLTSYTKQGEAAVTHLQVGHASAKINAAKQVIARMTQDMDAASAPGKDYMPIMERGAMSRDCAYADQLVWEAAEMISDAAGGSFARRGFTLSCIWADIKVATMHPYISRTSNFEMFGRMACGINPPLMPV